jgi:hypothetical protein
MRMTTVCTTFGLMLCGASALADDDCPDWDDHGGELSFLFDNHFDMHQQSHITEAGRLEGFLYIHFSGVTTADGLPIASHADCNAQDCSVGWKMAGEPREAEFAYHVMPDHPVFLIERSEIPQPGAYSHFHRRGLDMESSGAGYVLELYAVQPFCFIHENPEGADPEQTCQQNGGVPVSPGFDVATHLNLVTSLPVPPKSPM